MKVTSHISILALLFSTAAMASSPIEALSVETIKQTLTNEQIQAKLDQWKAKEIARIEATPIIQIMNDGAPQGARQQLAKQQVEQKYNFYIRELNL